MPISFGSSSRQMRFSRPVLPSRGDQCGAVGDRQHGMVAALQVDVEGVYPHPGLTWTYFISVSTSSPRMLSKLLIVRISQSCAFSQTLMSQSKARRCPTCSSPSGTSSRQSSACIVVGSEELQQGLLLQLILAERWIESAAVVYEFCHPSNPFDPPFSGKIGNWDTPKPPAGGLLLHLRFYAPLS